MYNTFREGQAKFAMDEFVDAGKSMDSAVNDFETAADNACGMIDDLENERDDLVGRETDLEKQVDDLEAEIAKLRLVKTPEKCIEVLKSMEAASLAMTVFAQANIKKLETAYGLEKSSPDSGSGTDSAGSREVSFDENGKPISPPGRPSN